MLVGGVERCARCGTQLRGGRTLCPSCGMDQSEVTEAVAVVEPEAAAEPVAAPIKKTICPACMTSVREDTMVTFERTRMCPTCHERLKGRQDRKKAEVL